KSIKRDADRVLADWHRIEVKISLHIALHRLQIIGIFRLQSHGCCCHRPMLGIVYDPAHGSRDRRQYRPGSHQQNKQLPNLAHLFSWDIQRRDKASRKYQSNDSWWWQASVIACLSEAGEKEVQHCGKLQLPALS